MIARPLFSAAFAIVVLGFSPASAEDAPAQPSPSDKAAIDKAVMAQVSKCWSPPPVRSLPAPRVVLGFELTRKGALAAQPVVIEAKSQALDPTHVAAAVRAVQKCAPYALPARFFDHWRKVYVTFALLLPTPASPSPQ